MHPTVKPVALIADAIRDCSNRRDIVLDPFGGSGSTLIAAEQTGRRARLIEIDARYADTIVRRWQGLTGGEAVDAASGQTFGQREAAQNAKLQVPKANRPGSYLLGQTDRSATPKAPPIDDRRLAAVRRTSSLERGKCLPALRRSSLANGRFYVAPKVYLLTAPPEVDDHCRMTASMAGRSAVDFQLWPVSIDEQT